MTEMKRSITADRDAVEEMVRRRGLAATVKLVAQVTAASNRHYQATGETCKLDDGCYACAWDIAQAFLDNTADALDAAMRRVD